MTPAPLRVKWEKAVPCSCLTASQVSGIWPSTLISPKLIAAVADRQTRCGGVAQLGERRVRNAKVTGSIPVTSTTQ